MNIRIITVSDRAAAGVYQDETGPAVENVLANQLPEAQVSRVVIPDEAAALLNALAEAEACDIVLTAGGTGLSPRDITPETVLNWGDKEVPGIAEYLRASSVSQTNRAVLSRGVAVQKAGTLAINLPGSVRGATFCAERLASLLPHAVVMMAGGGHPEEPGVGTEV